MFVQIGKEIYDSNEQLIMIKISNSEKRLISSMLEHQSDIFAAFPDNTYSADDFESKCIEFRESIDRVRRVTDI